MTGNRNRRPDQPGGQTPGAGLPLATAKSDALLAELKLLHPKLIDLSLGRIERLLLKLGRPQDKLPPVIHIAGTNGKGSVTATLQAMIEAAGKSAHVYTSPHLVRFHERIALGRKDGAAAPIAEDALVDVLARTQRVNDNDDITQFEITTAAAFLAFAEHPADVLLLEVGLGGRLDATNVVARPALTVITPVSLDHTEKLGATLARIAYEKAGILKRGVTCVVAAQDLEALEAIEAEAERTGAALVAWGRDFDAYEQNGRLIVQKENALLDLPLPALVGRHQIGNAGTAVACALELGFLGVSEHAIEQGLVKARWPARMQRLSHGPLPALLGPDSELWLDGGHNPAAGRVLAQTLADFEDRVGKPLTLVVGMLNVKDAKGFLAPFQGLARRVLTVPIPGTSEAPFPPERLAELAAEAGLTARACGSIEEALRMIAGKEHGPQRVLICGSLYLAGHVLAVQEQGGATSI